MREILLDVTASLRNTTVSPIVMGSLTIPATSSVLIWDTVTYSAIAYNNIVNTINAPATFNQNVGASNLVLTITGSDLTATQAFDLYHDMKQLTISSGSQDIWNQVQQQNINGAANYISNLSSGSIDTAIVRFDGTSGKFAQSSFSVVRDDGTIATTKQFVINTGSADMSLAVNSYLPSSSFTLLAEYLMNEASSGTGPTQIVANWGGINLVTMSYSGSSTGWTSTVSGSGLDMPSTSNKLAGAWSDQIGNGTFYNALNGSTQATFVLVAQIYSDLFETYRNVAGLSTTSVRNLNWTIVDNVWYLGLDFGNQNEYQYDIGFGIHVIHVVIDTNQAVSTDRIKVYVDGILTTSISNFGGYPTQGATLPITSDVRIHVGGIPSQFTAACAVYYMAFTDVAMSLADIQDTTTSLITNNDQSISDLVAVSGHSLLRSKNAIQLVGLINGDIETYETTVGSLQEAGVIIPSQQTDKPALVVYGASGQTADLLQVRNNTSSVVGFISASGLFGATNGVQLGNNAWLSAKNSTNTSSINIARVNSSDALELGPGSTTRLAISDTEIELGPFGANNVESYFRDRVGDSTQAAYYLLPSGTSRTSINYHLAGNSSQVNLNAPGGGSLSLRVSGTPYVDVNPTRASFNFNTLNGAVQLMNQSGSTVAGAVYLGGVSPSNTNYSLIGDSSTTTLNAVTTNAFAIAGTTKVALTTNSLSSSIPLTASSGLFTGPGGITGSLTRLANGSAYLIAGTNVSIVSQSNGSIVINSAGSGGGGADPNISYVVLANSASLPNERVLSSSLGLWLIDGGAGNAIDLKINDDVVATVTGTRFTGPIAVISNASGSVYDQAIYIYGTDDSDRYVQSNNFTVDGPAAVDKGVVYSDVGVPHWQNYIYRDEGGEYFYLYNNDLARDVIVSTAGGRHGFNKQTNALDSTHHSFFSGSGLNDMYVGGYYTGSLQRWYSVGVSTTGTPDQFVWRSSFDGINYSANSSALTMSLTPIMIDKGVTVQFGATTGHTSGSIWSFVAFPQRPLGTVTVSAHAFDEVQTTSDYTVGSPTWTDITFGTNSLSTYTPGQSTGFAPVTILPTGTTSAIYIGKSVSFSSIYVGIVTAAQGATLVFEYWNGSTWVAFTPLKNEVGNFNQTGLIEWEKNTLVNWTLNSLPNLTPSANLYWVRIRSTTNVTVAPTAYVCTTGGDIRFGVQSAYYDGIFSFAVDALGRVLLGPRRASGNNLLQIGPRGSLPTLVLTSSIIQIDSDLASNNDFVMRLAGTGSNDSSGLVFARSRGSIATGSIVSSGDRLGEITSYAFGSSSWGIVSSILFETSGALGPAGIIPGRIRFLVNTGSAGGTLSTAMSVDRDATVSFPIGLTGSNTRLPSGATTLASSFTSGINIITASSGQVQFSINNNRVATTSGSTFTGAVTLATAGGVTGSHTRISSTVVAFASSFTSGINIITASNNQVQFSINNNVVATVSGTRFTGPVSASAGLSGSLQQISAGLPYLVASGTIQLTTASNGQITIYAQPCPNALQTHPYAMINNINIDVYSNTATWGGCVVPSSNLSVIGLQACVYQTGTGYVTGAIYNAVTNARLATSTGADCSAAGIVTMNFVTPVTMSQFTPYYLAISTTANGSRFAGRSDSAATFNNSPKPSFNYLNNFLPTTLIPAANASLVWLSTVT